MEKRIYTSITETTLTAARDRVLDDLNALTDGKAYEAIKYAAEFAELDGILEEHRKREKAKAEAAKAAEEYTKSRFIESAAGEDLDRIAALHGVTRSGRSDEELRAYLNGIITRQVIDEKVAEMCATAE